MSAADEVVDEFLVESREHLDRFDRDLCSLGQGPSAPGLLASMLRTIHTVKGTGAALGLVTLAAVAHAAESLLAALRDGHRPVTGEVAGALLAAGDALRGILAAVDATGGEGPDDHRDLVATLRRLHRGSSGPLDRGCQGSRSCRPSALPGTRSRSGSSPRSPRPRCTTGRLLREHSSSGATGRRGESVRRGALGGDVAGFFPRGGERGRQAAEQPPDAARRPRGGLADTGPRPRGPRPVVLEPAGRADYRVCIEGYGSGTLTFLGA